MSDPRDPFAKLEERRIRREAERQQMNKRHLELNAEGERDTITLQTLRVMFPNGWDGDVLVAAERVAPKPEKEEPAPPSFPAAARQDRGAGMTVKDIALAILSEAYPDGLTSSQIKARAKLRYRRDLNSNTLTVSLVRSSKGPDAKARCVRRTWFYNRPGNGVAKAALQSEISLPLGQARPQ